MRIHQGVGSTQGKDEAEEGKEKDRNSNNELLLLTKVEKDIFRGQS